MKDTTKPPGVLACLAGVLACLAALWADEPAAYRTNYYSTAMMENPYAYQVRQLLDDLKSPRESIRAAAANIMGYMQERSVEPELVKALADASAEVRRYAAISLGWLGGRVSLRPLLDALGDSQWEVRQAAWAALCNITGMDLPFDGTAAESTRKTRAAAWGRAAGKILAELDAGGVPADWSAMLKSDDFIRKERAARAMGAMAAKGASPLICAEMGIAGRIKRNNRNYNDTTVFKTAYEFGFAGGNSFVEDYYTFEESRFIKAAIKALGRLAEPEGFDKLSQLYGEGNWARYAADALGDIKTEAAGLVLMEHYAKYADRRDKDNFFHTLDDNMGWPGGARTYAIPYFATLSLCRIDFKSPAAVGKLKTLKNAILSAAYIQDSDEMISRHYMPMDQMADWLLKCAGDYGPRTAAACLPSLKNPNEGGRKLLYAARELMLLGDKSALPALKQALAETRPEGAGGYFKVHLDKGDIVAGPEDEYESIPLPRPRGWLCRAIGYLGGDAEVPILENQVWEELNTYGTQYAAAEGLAAIGTEAAARAMIRMEKEHPIQSIRLLAREFMWKRAILPQRDDMPRGQAAAPAVSAGEAAGTAGARPDRFVFISGPKKAPGIDRRKPESDRSRGVYISTNSGPTYRLGNNLCVLDVSGKEPKARPLTGFKDGFVADCEVSWDGKRVIFSRRGGDDDPWWHIFEINADGSGLRRLTAGPHSDICPAYLPDGRIIFTSTRIGVRDEYHGFSSTGLAVMDADGKNIECIGVTTGHDNEPSVGPGGQIVFNRTEAFYMMVRLENSIQSVFPDGSHALTLFGPEARFDNAGVSERTRRWKRVKFTQPQMLEDGRILCVDGRSLCLVGPGRMDFESLNAWATTPFPLGAGRIICAAAVPPADGNGRNVKAGWAESNKGDAQGKVLPAEYVDLGLYCGDLKPGGLTMTLLYNDPATSEFEARPLIARPRPPVLPRYVPADPTAFTATLFCASIYDTQEPEVRKRAKFIRVVEGLPETERQTGGITNHTGTIGRIWGTVPVTPEGSFRVEIPADRMFHLQALDSDGYVVGNELVWQTVRPGETRSCAGCHEKPDKTAAAPLTAPGFKTIQCLPQGRDFLYRAKMWQLNDFCPEQEERMRTVNSFNYLGRLP